MLVVEDEAPIRMLVCDMLEAAGYMCIEAADAAEALILLDIGLCRPDILVTDFNLGPGLNGQALAAEVSRKLPGLAVTFVTGNSEAFDDYRLRPWERLVAKPFSGPELVEAVSGLRPPHQIDPLGAASARREPITGQSAEIQRNTLDRAERYRSVLRWSPDFGQAGKLSSPVRRTDRG